MVARAAVGLIVSALLATGLAGCLGETPLAAGGIAPVGLPVVAGSYNFTKNFSQVLQTGAYGILPIELALLQSDLDDADIPIGIFRPDVPEDVKVPIIVHASPYFAPDLASEGNQNRMARMRENFVQHGYPVVELPVRGTANAGGCMDLMGRKERHDLDQAITWLATQPWSNGNVGLIGVSYDGSTPFEMAATQNPHVKTIVPVSGLPDIYDLMFRNGTAETRGPIALNLLYYNYWMTTGRDLDHQLSGVVCPESWTGFGAALWAGGTGAKDPGGWWEERNSRPAIESTYEGSILFVQGLQDWNVDPALTIPWIQRLADQGIDVHQVLGQWPHAWPDSACRNDKPLHPACRWDWAELTLRWFDRWLKEDSTIDVGPAVQVQRQDGVWRTESSWPPHDAMPMRLELTTAGLVAEGASAPGSSKLAPNPNGAMSTNVPGSPVGVPSPASFYRDFTYSVREDIHIAGLPKVHVTVVPDGPGGTLAAWLYRRDADGEMHRIGWTAMNLAFADGTTEMTPVVPGEELLARMQIQPLDAFVPAGSQLVLRMWQYPPPDRMANAPPATMQIVWGDGKSTLELPVIERDGSTDFTVPVPEPS